MDVSTPSIRARIERTCGRVVDARWFNPFIVGVIALSAVWPWGVAP